MIIRNKIILILWRPWEGKTYLATFLASYYERIFSNVNIDKNGKSMSKFISSIDEIESIKFSEKKGVVLLDEWGVNVNARRSQSNENRIYGELWMLWRKLNVDIIICAQLGRMVDVYFRELANYVFEMHAWFDRPGYLMFEARIYRYNDGNKNLIKIARFDLFEWSRLSWITYSTLETSKISKSKKEKWDEEFLWDFFEINRKHEIDKKEKHDDYMSCEICW